MRITTSMVTRNVLADLNSISEKLTRSQLKASSNKEISKPSDDPFGAARAMALRQSLDGVRDYAKNAQDGMDWVESSELALNEISRAMARARDLIVSGSSDSVDQTSREAISAELTQIIDGIKQTAGQTYRGSYVFSGAETSTAPYVQGADDTYHGDEAGLDPALPGIVREIGPGVTVKINVIGRQVLGDGQGAADNKLLDVLRDAVDHLNAGDGPSLRNDISRLDTNIDNVLSIRATNGAVTNRLEAAVSRLQEIEESNTRQLSDVEDADIAKTLIELNSQTAAYQAALRAGASIVQTSLMDFLR
ncbi:MAG TPA: flagellin [Solirubrobacteraceae bacterium]|nr:flagellin [Solirubrobacteraceae bacterium]